MEKLISAIWYIRLTFFYHLVPQRRKTIGRFWIRTQVLLHRQDYSNLNFFFHFTPKNVLTPPFREIAEAPQDIGQTSRLSSKSLNTDLDLGPFVSKMLKQIVVVVVFGLVQAQAKNVALVIGGYGGGNSVEIITDTKVIQRRQSDLHMGTCIMTTGHQPVANAKKLLQAFIYKYVHTGLFFN